MKHCQIQRENRKKMAWSATTPGSPLRNGTRGSRELREKIREERKKREKRAWSATTPGSPFNNGTKSPKKIGPGEPVVARFSHSGCRMLDRNAFCHVPSIQNPFRGCSIVPVFPPINGLRKVSPSSGDKSSGKTRWSRPIFSDYIVDGDFRARGLTEESLLFLTTSPFLGALLRPCQPFLIKIPDRRRQAVSMPDLNKKFPCKVKGT
jgi:hypothetical protein